MGNKPTTGLASFNIKKSAEEHKANPHYRTTYLRTQYVDDPIQTTEPGAVEPIQVPGLAPSKRYGPFQKRYTEGWVYGSDPLFVPPETLTVPDGAKGQSEVQIVCRCRDIPTFMRDNKGDLILNNMLQELTSEKDIGCWDDGPQLMNPQKWSFEFNPYNLDEDGKDTFFIVSNHQLFRQEMVTGDLVGNAFRFFSSRKGRNTRKHARKHARKHTRKHARKH